MSRLFKFFFVTLIAVLVSLSTVAQTGPVDEFGDSTLPPPNRKLIYTFLVDHKGGGIAPSDNVPSGGSQCSPHEVLCGKTCCDVTRGLACINQQCVNKCTRGRIWVPADDGIDGHGSCICPEGRVWSAIDNWCVELCEEGYIWSSINGRCELICPGRFWSRLLKECVDCLTDTDCATNPLKFCNTHLGHCVECNVSEDCPNSATCVDHSCRCPGSYWSAGKQMCVECLIDPHCPENEVCSVNNICVECNVDKDCPAGKTCVNNICRDRECVKNDECGPDAPWCNDKRLCVRCLTDSNCPGGGHCTGGDCSCPDGRYWSYALNKCVECLEDAHCASESCNISVGECCLVGYEESRGHCCPVGQVWDTTAKKCLCPKGTTWTEDQGEGACCSETPKTYWSKPLQLCVECTLNEQCASKSCDIPNGVCCQEGEYYAKDASGLGACCLIGQAYVDGKCTCPADQHWTQDQDEGRCCPLVPDPTYWSKPLQQCVECTKHEHCDISQSCNLPKGVCCKEGEKYSEVSPGVGMCCPIGQTFDGKQCSCPVGQYWSIDGDEGACCPNVPAMTYWSKPLQECVECTQHEHCTLSKSCILPLGTCCDQYSYYIGEDNMCCPNNFDYFGNAHCCPTELAGPLFAKTYWSEYGGRGACCPTEQYFDGTNCICPDNECWDDVTKTCGVCSCPAGEYWSEHQGERHCCPENPKLYWFKPLQRCLECYQDDQCTAVGKLSCNTDDYVCCGTNEIFHPGQGERGICCRVDLWPSNGHCCPEFTEWSWSGNKDNGKCCPTDQHYDGMNCVCPTDLCWDNDAQACVTCPPVTCPTGEYMAFHAASGLSQCCKIGEVFNGITCYVEKPACEFPMMECNNDGKCVECCSDTDCPYYGAGGFCDKGWCEYWPPPVGDDDDTWDDYDDDGWDDYDDTTWDDYDDTGWDDYDDDGWDDYDDWGW